MLKIHAVTLLFPDFRGGAGRLFRRLCSPAAQEYAAHGNFFFNKAAMGGHGGIGHETFLHYPVAQIVGYGDQTHPQMVGHDAADGFSAVEAAAGGGEVHGLPKTEAAESAELFKPPEVRYGVDRFNDQGQEGTVRRYDQLVVHPPLQSQGRAAVRLIAIGKRRIKGEKGAFRSSPGQLALYAAALDVHTELCALPEKGFPAEGQEKFRHQIFKHGARPACHPPVAVLLHHGAAELPPVAAGRVALGDGHVARQTRLAGHKVVPALGGGV